MVLNREERSRISPAKQWAQQRESDHFGASAIKVPDGFELYKLEPGTHKVDFMPYLVGKGNSRAKEGSEYFMRTYKIHWVPIPGGKTKPFTCSFECFQTRCPVCDWLKKNGNTADPELVKGLRGKTRHLWVVNDKPGKKNNKLKVLDTNDWNRGFGFGDLMQDALGSMDDEINPFALKGGCFAVLIVKEQTMGEGRKYNAATRIEFKPRDYDYPPSLLEEAPCLDDCLVQCDYDEVTSILEGGGTPDVKKDYQEDTRNERVEDRRRVKDEDEEEPEPKPSPRRKKDEDEDSDDKKEEEITAKQLGLKEGDIVMFGKIECEVIRISPDGTGLTLEDEGGGSLYRGVSPSEVKKVPVKENHQSEKEAPSSKSPQNNRSKGARSAEKSTVSASTKNSPSKEDDDLPDDPFTEDEDWDNDEKPEEVPVARGKKSSRGE